jgi:hypothetical protein
MHTLCVLYNTHQIGEISFSYLNKERSFLINIRTFLKAALHQGNNWQHVAGNIF